jgi:hypothetical protein
MGKYNYEAEEKFLYPEKQYEVNLVNSRDDVLDFYEMGHMMVTPVPFSANHPLQRSFQNLDPHGPVLIDRTCIRSSVAVRSDFYPAKNFPNFSRLTN